MVVWLRFDEGYSSYLEATYSQNLLYNAELIRTGVQRSLLQAFANLYKAMGWEDDGLIVTLVYLFAPEGSLVSSPWQRSTTADIVPRTEIARGLATVEGVGGQLFLTVLVARLVSLYVRRKDAN
jgi:hypothetical protein